MKRALLPLAIVASFAGSFAGACSDGAQPTAVDASVDGQADVASDAPIDAPFGLDVRPANPACLAPARPPGAATVRLVRVWPNVVMQGSPMRIAQIPGDTSRMFVAYRGGQIASFPTANPPTTPTMVLQVPKVVNSDGEGGLLGFAFHPNFAKNGHVFFSYTTDGGSTGMRSVVARMTSTDGGASFSPSSYVEIVPPFEQPFINHNGGDVRFGRDGLLYLSFGDGGSGSDPLDNGQKLTSFLSKIIRIDVDNPDSGKEYGIPKTNPFAGSSVAEPAAFAYGFRNPFRFSIDPATNQVWVGDVGQYSWEEVDKVQAGGNYGWSSREGRHCFKPSVGCPTAGLIDPVWEYDHPTGYAIIGGPIYRGKAIPSLVGSYVAADYGGRVWILSEQSDGSWTETEVTDTGGGVGWSAFDVDDEGEVYGVALSGELYELVATGPIVPSTFPDLLSKTGCVDPLDPKRPGPGLVPFEPISPLWSDGAEKERYFAIPDGATITVGADGDFDFPPSSVLMKHFRVAGKLVETRLFVRHADGGWGGYTYEWNDAQTDAALLPSAKQKSLPSGSYYFPSRAECLRCHTAPAGSSLGLETLQLNSDFVYTATNRRSNQLRTLEHIGLFTQPLPGPVTTLPSLAAPSGQGSLDARARSYLHANCSFCHRPNGGGGGAMNLLFSTDIRDLRACGATPQAGDLGIAGARLLAPGDPSASLIAVRPKRMDPYRMPPLATIVVDTEGTALLDHWVNSLGACPPLPDAGSD